MLGAYPARTFDARLSRARNQFEAGIAIGAVERFEFAIQAANGQDVRRFRGFVVLGPAVGAFKGAIHTSVTSHDYEIA
jgi:hypothetical protein